ncbi:MAG: BlaI/MecI/CopY family transcriptional regulator [Pseudomonadota bacterium]
MADPLNLAPVELELMQTLWRLGTGTAREVLDALPPERQVAYTTVQTQLNILRRKGFLDAEREGKAHRYRPLVSLDAVRSSALGRLVDSLFDRSGRTVAQQLVRTGALSAEDVDELRELVDRLDEETGDQS